MPEFIPVLIIAVVLFAAMLLAFGGIVAPPPTPGPGLPTEEYRHFALGGSFSVGYMAAEQLVGSTTGAVSRGLLSGEDKKVSFSLTTPGDVTGGHVSWHVNDTNGYGRLIIALNGAELYRDFAWPGDHAVTFDPKLLRRDNLLEISAESSGWRFWAPTVYILSATAAISWHGALSQNFTFNLTGGEAATATKGRLVIYATEREGTGQLTAKLNSQRIYADVKTAVLQDFSADYLQPGLNTVELTTPAGTRYTIESAEVVVYWV